jgi:hypothetical protein
MNLMLHNVIFENNSAANNAINSSTYTGLTDALKYFVNVAITKPSVSVNESTLIRELTISTDILDLAPRQLVGLSCDAYVGPSDEYAQQEMVYWEDVAPYLCYRSPFKKANEGKKQYLTFEPNQAGRNNIQMSMETVVVVTHAMG